MTDKVLLCAIAKQENKYIKEWVDYHLNLGFDHITIYDNNDTGGERISDALSNDMRVDIVDFRGKKQKSCETQVEAYNHCYKNAKNYTWVLFIDIDEFLWFRDYDNIKVFLAQNWVRKANVIRFHWKCYSDNDQLHYEDRPVMERFTQPCSNVEVNYHTKQMYRTNLGTLRIVNVHYSTNVAYIFYPDGKPAPYTTSTKDSSIHDELAHVKHYVTKSLEEYVRIKWARRCEGSSKTRLSMDFYFKYNKRTDEKVRYYRQLMNELKNAKAPTTMIKKSASTNETVGAMAFCPGANTRPVKPVTESAKIAPNSAYNPKDDKVYPFGVSVCISAWKTAEYIEECLDSVAAQTWFKDNDNYEILLGIDGCEETLAKVKEIMGKYKNLKVMMMDKNIGTYVTCNTIMKEARYEWLLRFDSDDVMYPNMVEVLMKKKGNAEFVLCKYNNKKNGDKTFLAEGQIFVGKDCFMRYGGFLNRRCGSDTEFRKRTENKIKQLQIQDTLLLRRERTDSLTKVNDYGYKSKYRDEVKQYIKEKSPNIGKIELVTENHISIFDNRKYVDDNFCGKQYNEEKAIISLTSFRARINTVHITIESLLKYCDGYHIVLVLSTDEFPKKNNELPRTLLDLINGEKIELLWVKRNYKALKKIAFTAHKYKDVPIISADDDCRYICNYADELYNKFIECPNDVIRYNMYNKDDNWQYTQGPSTLYPPKYYSVIFEPILEGLRNHTITDYMNDDTVITKIIKNNKIHISHVHRGTNFCFKFHNENGAMHNNRINKDFESCYE